MKEVGILLRETREIQGYDIDHAAKELKVRPEYLKILESGDVSSVSNEIYILGYLKSYSSWLGLNSNEIINKFKSLNGNLSVTKNVCHDSSVFINIEERMLSSNKPIYLLSALLLALFFVANRDSSDADLLFVSGVPISEYGEKKHPYAGFSYNKEVNGKIMLMAKSDLGVKLNYADNLVKSEYLTSGEVYFLSSDKDVLISSNRPKDIDVFSDDENGKYLGTLEEFYVYN